MSNEKKPYYCPRCRIRFSGDNVISINSVTSCYFCHKEVELSENVTSKTEGEV